MMVIYEFFIVVWVILITIFEGFMVCNTNLGADWGFVTSPKWIYKHSKYNIFGCTLLWALVRLLSPIGTIWLLIYWIFHVGRKKGN